MVDNENGEGEGGGVLNDRRIASPTYDAYFDGVVWLGRKNLTCNNLVLNDSYEKFQASRMKFYFYVNKNQEYERDVKRPPRNRKKDRKFEVDAR